MADEIEITHGGIVAVDPAAMRDWSARMRACAARVREAQQDLLAVPVLVAQAGAPAVPAVWAAGRGLETAGAELDALALTATDLADVFELAELRARQAMLAPADEALAEDLRGRVERLLAGNERLPALEQRLTDQWRSHVTEGFSPSTDPGTFLALVAVNPAAAITYGYLSWLNTVRVDTGRNAMSAAAAENGVVPPVPLGPTPGLVLTAGPQSATPAAAMPGDIVLTRGTASSVPAGPPSLGGAVARVPFGEKPQVRVETYAMPDGTRRFVAYVDGTRGTSGAEPWRFGSNVTAYARHEESDAYKVVVAALRDAGADADSAVDLVGYSQGGMIADLVAQSGEFDVRGVFTVGSPTEPGLPESVLSVAVRHTDRKSVV